VPRCVVRHRHVAIVVCRQQIEQAPPQPLQRPRRCCRHPPHQFTQEQPWAVACRCWRCGRQGRGLARSACISRVGSRGGGRARKCSSGLVGRVLASETTQVRHAARTPPSDRTWWPWRGGGGGAEPRGRRGEGASMQSPSPNTGGGLSSDARGSASLLLLKAPDTGAATAPMPRCRHTSITWREESSAPASHRR